MSETTDFRKAKDEFMGTDHQSPLTDEQRRDFHGLNYYQDDPDLKFELELDEFEDQETIEMQTSTGDVAEYVRLGRVSFSVGGEQAALTVFGDDHGHELFLPFADATSTDETYPAGRYLDVERHGNKLLVDFNYAYNPYCAYNESWSCPLTPFENRVAVPITAGEKNFK